MSAMSCFGECLEMGPPPDYILEMPPPPPLPAFYPADNGNESTQSPCLTAMICHVASSHVTTVPDLEITRQNLPALEHSWLMVWLASGFGVILIASLVLVFLLKFRMAYTIQYVEGASNKHPPLTTKDRPLISAEESSLYPCSSSSGSNNMQDPDNRVLWTAMTPSGTKHFLSENYSTENPYESVEHFSMKPSRENGGLPYHITDSYNEDNYFETIDNYNLTSAIDPYNIDYHSAPDRSTRSKRVMYYL